MHSTYLIRYGLMGHIGQFHARQSLPMFFIAVRRSSSGLIVVWNLARY